MLKFWTKIGSICTQSMWWGWLLTSLTPKVCSISVKWSILRAFLCLSRLFSSYDHFELGELQKLISSRGTEMITFCGFHLKSLFLFLRYFPHQQISKHTHTHTREHDCLPFWLRAITICLSNIKQFDMTQIARCKQDCGKKKIPKNR